MTGVFLIVASFIFDSAVVVVDGVILSHLWRWFIVPVFKLPLLSVPQAIGVAIVVAYMTHQRVPDGDSEIAEMISSIIAHNITRIILAIVLAHIVKYFL